MFSLYSKHRSLRLAADGEVLSRHSTLWCLSWMHPPDAMALSRFTGIKIG
jgi:hypothetical protein